MVMRRLTAKWPREECTINRHSEFLSRVSYVPEAFEVNHQVRFQDLVKYS
jgi:hypothetical protein